MNKSIEVKEKIEFADNSMIYVVSCLIADDNYNNEKLSKSEVAIFYYRNDAVDYIERMCGTNKILIIEEYDNLQCFVDKD